jgi:acetyl-CoA acetyltransferase
MRRAAIVSPIRTGVGRFGGLLAGFPAGELGAIILKALMARTKIDPARRGWRRAFPNPCQASRSIGAADRACRR